jgi:mannan endo-1,4-beta-mannosidase
MRLLSLVLFVALPLCVQCAIFQAENGQLIGGATVSTESGVGYITNFKNDADAVRINITGGTEQLYSISFSYRSIYGEKKAKMTLNDKYLGEYLLPQASTWTTIVVAPRNLMVQGLNTLLVSGGWGYWEFDYVETKLTTLPPKPVASGLPVDKNATVEAKYLLAFLQNHYGTKTLSGQQDLADAKWVKDNVGKYPAVLGLDFMDYSPSRVERGATSNDVEEAIEWSQMGGITTFVWHWNAPTGLIDGQGDLAWYKGFNTKATTFDLQSALNEGVNGQNYTLLLRDIDAIAVQLKRLSDLKIPILFRPLHEAEGGWFWWGAKGPAPCIQLYKILYDRITNYHNIHNLLWVWNSVNSDWYVGDEFCDIVSFDYYDDTTPPSHSPSDTTFDKLVELGGSTKIVTMAECGPIPSTNLTFIYQSVWSYFVTWNGFEKNTNLNSLDYLKATYNDDRVITLDELISMYNSTIVDNGTVPATAPATTPATVPSAVPSTPTPGIENNSTVKSTSLFTGSANLIAGNLFASMLIVFFSIWM